MASIADLQTENSLLKQENASIEKSFLLQSLLMHNILEENNHLKGLYSQSKIKPNDYMIQDIIRREKENEFLSYNYFSSSSIFGQNRLPFNNNYIDPLHHIMKNTSDGIVIHIIKHLSNNRYVVRVLEEDSYFWSLANFSCKYSRLSILKYLLKNNIGIRKPEEILVTASKYSNDETITYLLDGKYADSLSLENKSVLHANLDKNPNLDSINKITLKNRVTNYPQSQPKIID